ncbi:hypothetical protein SS1G_11042 [Sclerotinia sclerotiorum 1980 UF-70]|uniref:Uncharacterized protein n=1 Tax=Sclerotinia sclerotiorum (strain ATCC 18683 / 1980 / Ss-1) TaxID=665079 RepID=A7F0C5_SCLS1|nr:hypothetical protein SS1G_11042 [Sclerotinia sclerotiorum 1980 UF-70]EDN95167.1 hypothetical protein SS1G_11042 [Sclerotinia sclerotiorum 1980 UF-70]
MAVGCRSLHTQNISQIFWNFQLQKVSESKVNPEILWSSDRLYFKTDPKRFFLAPDYGQNYISKNFGPSYAQLLDPRKRRYSLVNEYAARSLTFETDRLYALAALAQKFETQFRLTYWIGIWAKDIHDDLLWTTVGPVSIPEAYVAPSLSWGSLGFNTQSPGQDFKYYSKSEGEGISNSRFRAQIAGYQWPVSADVSLTLSNTSFPEEVHAEHLLLKFDRLSEDGWF